VAWYPDNGASYDLLVKYADFAMYSAKNSTKGDSCDTTQIDVLKRPLASRAITRARWITGGSPSVSTKPMLFKPPSKGHSHGCSPS